MNRFSNPAGASCYTKENNLNRTELDDDISALHSQEVDGSFAGCSLEFEVLSEVTNHSSDIESVEGFERTIRMPSNSQPAQWSRPAVYYLIETYKRLARAESCGNINFGAIAIWTHVAEKLRERGFTFTPEQCRTKWSLLKKLYQHIRNSLQAAKFEFLEAIHNYYKDPRVESILNEMNNNKRNHSKRRATKRKLTSIESVEDIETNVLNVELEQFLAKGATSDAAGQEDQSASINLQYLLDCEDSRDSAEKLEVEHDNGAYANVLAFHSNDSERVEEGANKVNDDELTTVLMHSDFMDEFKKIVMFQEKRRDDRHNEKMRIFREYQERVLAQQEQAINMHKELMERLTNTLL